MSGLKVKEPLTSRSTDVELGDDVSLAFVQGSFKFDDGSPWARCPAVVQTAPVDGLDINRDQVRAEVWTC